MNKFACYVVDENDELLVGNVNFVEFLSKEANGKITHVLVSYWKDQFKEDSHIFKVFPIEHVYFGKAY